MKARIKERYYDDPDASIEEKRDYRERREDPNYYVTVRRKPQYIKLPTQRATRRRDVPKCSRKMPTRPLTTGEPLHLMTHSCEHETTYIDAQEIENCFLCGKTWPKAYTYQELKAKVESAPQSVVPRKRGRPPKIKTPLQERGPAEELARHNIDRVLTPELPDDVFDGDGLRGTPSVSVPGTPSLEGTDNESSKKGRTGKSAQATTDDRYDDYKDYGDPGPWDGSLKCPLTSCMARIRWHGPNIVNNGKKTYHYGCPNCVDVRVTLHIGEII